MFISVGIPKLAPNRPDVAHGRVHRGREHERDTSLLQRPRRELDRCIEHDTKLLQYVGAARLRGERAVTVLRDPHSSAGSEQCGGRGDVERRHGTATGSARVHQIALVAHWQVDHGRPQRAGGAGDFVRGLALHAQTDEQRRDLSRRALPAHHRPERLVARSASNDSPNAIRRIATCRGFAVATAGAVTIDA
jgi:hypothetical protein